MELGFSNRRGRQNKVVIISKHRRMVLFRNKQKCIFFHPSVFGHACRRGIVASKEKHNAPVVRHQNEFDTLLYPLCNVKGENIEMYLH